ncbi:hypothetical protein D9613_012956 [Agrocybe pediades]|uniref:Uncharacterized protein n=1 Tax=Agrocybe pediades TaxID=84607 RepID=A0A8H4VS23_9AGAR|nr:hypothetical protein D9613_012956 [Agrocybe pediades]
MASYSRPCPYNLRSRAVRLDSTPLAAVPGGSHPAVNTPPNMSIVAPRVKKRVPDQAKVLHSSFSLSSTLPRYKMEAASNNVHLAEEDCDVNVFDGSLNAMCREDMKEFAEQLLSIKALLWTTGENQSSSTKKKTKRGGVRNTRAEEFAKGDAFLQKQYSLNERAYSNALIVTGVAFDVSKDCPTVSTGWHGRQPSLMDRNLIQDLYVSGEIKDTIEKQFKPVPYSLSNPQPALLIDCDGRTFGYRTTQVNWLKDHASIFCDAVLELLGPHIANPRLAAHHASGNRGPHFPCIIGHCRQYLKSPDLTHFHKENIDSVERFCRTNVIRRVTSFVSSLVITMFPGVALRTLRTAEWHEKKHGIRPLFGLFWNLCINGIFKGQKSVSTLPHVDAKNIIGICVVLVYLIPGYTFNHKKKAWLVLWEAGIAVELPPWVAFMYPSSLFLHFNIDIDDIKFVITDGDRPTKDNSSPLGGVGDEGRGSLVYYNQASMYNGPETGFDTLAMAKASGQRASVNSVEISQQAYPQHRSAPQ